MTRVSVNQQWMDRWMRRRGVRLWGAADLSGIPLPPAVCGGEPLKAVAWAVPMPPAVMSGIKDGPTQEYARVYRDVNDRINGLAQRLAENIAAEGFRATALAASERTDPIGIRGDFPHKTAATRAGLGWVGRHCQLVTRPYGPWVRLGTVFTDMPLVCGTPSTRSFCGRCRACVAACPAGALSGRDWHPGIKREEILDAARCDQWKKEHFFDYNHGHNCGICSAVCPYGLKHAAGRN